jgi:hypothetical protein
MIVQLLLLENLIKYFLHLKLDSIIHVRRARIIVILITISGT